MNFRLQAQLDEALGEVNGWFCSQAYGYEVKNPELLIAYYIKSGGAADFDKRYRQAMGSDNRWYCSEFHGRDIGDPKELWNYYLNSRQSPSSNKTGKNLSKQKSMELSGSL